jgi:HEAT repeat protein
MSRGAWTDNREDILVARSDVELLASSKVEERIKAAESMALGRDKAFVRPLCRALFDSNQVVRARAAWALGEIGDPAAITPLDEAIRKYEAMLSCDGFLNQTKCLVDMYRARRKLQGMNEVE